VRDSTLKIVDVNDVTIYNYNRDLHEAFVKDDFENILQ
jgi:hypothetical protein